MRFHFKNKNQNIRRIFELNNTLAAKLAGLIYRRVDFDNESIATLKEYSSKGKVVFVSYQQKSSSLVLLLTLLKKHLFPMPSVAIGFHLSPIQHIISSIKSFKTIILSIFAHDSVHVENSIDKLKNILLQTDGLVISILSRELFFERYVDIQNDSLQYLVDIQKSMDQPLYLFPQIMFWNRNPERRKTIISQRSTGDRGVFSAIFAVLFSATSAFMRVSTPINLKEIISGSDTDDSREIARSLRNKFLDIYSHEKRSILGPVMKSQQEMMENVLYNKAIIQKIEEMAHRKRVSIKRLRKKAFNYYRETATGFSIVFISILEFIVRFIYSRCFSGIIYNIEDIKKIREASQMGPLILMPAHRSLMDYFILSSIFYREKIVPPHIAVESGALLSPLSRIFKKAGAFSLRKTYQGHDLHEAVFKQYIKTLISEGYSIEFFMEGERTRTGKLVMPRVHFLRFLIEAIEEGYNKDMILVPVSINYGRILEESSYQKGPKEISKNTNISSPLKVKSRFFKREYGKIYVSFGDALSYQMYKETIKADSDTAEEIGNYIARRINEITKVTPFAVISSAILLSPLKGFTREVLARNFSVLLDYLNFINAPLSYALCGEIDVNQVVSFVMSSFEKDNIVTRLKIEESGEEFRLNLYGINEEERRRISFYKNTIVHYFLPQAFVSAALLSSSERNSTNKKSLISIYRSLIDLFSREFLYPEDMYDHKKTINRALKFFTRLDCVTVKAESVLINPEKMEILLLFSKLIKELLESYSIVLRTLEDSKKKLARNSLIYDIRKRGIFMYHQGSVVLSESLSMQNYKNALKKFENLGMIRGIDTTKKSSDIEIMNYEDIKSKAVFIELILKQINT